jgi:hypothetical protein
MAMFLDELISEFHTAVTLARRRAPGDYSGGQHLQTLPEYRRKSAGQRRARAWRFPLCSGLSRARSEQAGRGAHGLDGRAE